LYTTLEKSQAGVSMDCFYLDCPAGVSMDCFYLDCPVWDAEIYNRSYKKPIQCKCKHKRI